MKATTETTEVTTETKKESLKDILKDKFTSRKFILAFVGVVTGILGIIGCNDNTIAIVAFAVLEVLSIVGYIIMEGKIDAVAVTDVTELINELTSMINEAKNNGTVTTPDHSPSDDILPTLPEDDTSTDNK